MDWIYEPWPWYVAGPLIGLMVPGLLLLSGRYFGISSSFRHICAACIPTRIPYFRYHWKYQAWNLVFVAGVIIGAFISSRFLSNDIQVAITESTVEQLKALGVTEFSGLAPSEIFNFNALVNPKGFIMIVLGGFAVGFGTRYAGGCTSGHSIMGMSTLQKSSLIATIFFFIGGLISTHILLPLIMNL